MRRAFALVRATFLTAASYRIGMVLSIVGLAASVVPIYFISGALQPVVADSIRLEGGQYFGFLMVGIASTYLMSAAVSALPGSVSGSVGSGTFEALLVTRTPLPLLLLGMIGYPMLQSLFRAMLLLLGAAIVGVPIVWMSLPAVAVVALLLTAAYLAIGLVGGALILTFRTSGPLATATIAASGLLGGVYYSTTVIPSWLQDLSALVPLTYGLRAMRQLLLNGASLAEVSTDVAVLALIAMVLQVIGIAAFAFALRRARVSGTLSQY